MLKSLGIRKLILDFYECGLNIDIEIQKVYYNYRYLVSEMLQKIKFIGGRTMSKSIGKKVLTVMGILAVLFLGMLILNIAALQEIQRQEFNIEESMANYFDAAKKSDKTAMTEIEEDIAARTTKIDTKIDGTIIFDIILVVLFVIVMAVAIFMVLKTIVTPAKNAGKQLLSITKGIEAGEGDLTARINIKSKDEIGQLAKGINIFMNNLQTLMTKIKEASHHMRTSVDTITEQVNESNESAGSASAAMEQLSASMQEVSATLDQIAANSDAVFKEVQKMTEQADKGANLADTIKERADVKYKETVEGKNETGNMVGQMRAILEESVAESKSVEKINELTGDILDISSQTNLLALNASIEAARAGEAGKGFAVVADEIRVLADNSRDTANNIQTISAAVTGAVEKLADTAEELMKFVDKKVLKDYDGFVEIVNQYQKDADEINDIMSEFAKNASDMTRTMDDINTGINEISITVDESAKGITNVAENAVDLVSAMALIQEGTSDNQRISKELETEVKRFKEI